MCFGLLSLNESRDIHVLVKENYREKKVNWLNDEVNYSYLYRSVDVK